MNSFIKENKIRIFSYFKLCLVIRVILVCVNILFDVFISDHNAIGVEKFQGRFSTEYSELFLRPFTKWDSSHFLNISIFGYDQLYRYAFFPFFPLVIKFVASILIESELFYWLNSHEIMIIIGVFLNILSYSLAIFPLFYISKNLSLDTNEIKACLILFIFNPASVFFSSLYSESFYMLFSFMAFFLCMVASRNFIFSRLASSILFALASFTRSNGLFNSVFIISISVREYFLKQALVGSEIFWLVINLISSMSPYLIHNYNASIKACLVDESFATKQCHQELPNQHLSSYLSTYSYIQQKYWGVGLFKYYEWKQFPNFLLASPIVFFVLLYFWQFHSLENEKKIYSKRRSILLSFHLLLNDIISNVFFPHVLHLFVLMVICLLFAHVQIITRVLFSSSPLIYVILAKLSQKMEYMNWISLYAASYFIIGHILHPNFYPWT